jgi:hypothetical protein
MDIRAAREAGRDEGRDEATAAIARILRAKALQYPRLSDARIALLQTAFEIEPAERLKPSEEGPAA